jgi:hypothetical protein
VIVEEWIRLALDPARLHFVDPETSETLRPGCVRFAGVERHPVAAASNGARDLWRGHLQRRPG